MTTMETIVRESKTERRVRAMDALDIVQEIHGLEDERDALAARLAHEQATNANLLRALAEANDLNVVRRTAMVNLHEHIEKLDARLAEALERIKELEAQLANRS